MTSCSFRFPFRETHHFPLSSLITLLQLWIFDHLSFLDFQCHINIVGIHVSAWMSLFFCSRSWTTFQVFIHDFRSQCCNRIINQLCLQCLSLLLASRNLTFGFSSFLSFIGRTLCIQSRNGCCFSQTVDI